MKEKIIECLEKFKKGFKKGQWDNLNYRIDEIIDYLNCGELQIIMQIVSEDVFTLRCFCGFVYCLIEYNGVWDSEQEKQELGVDYVCGATFENKLNGESLTIQNLGEWENNIQDYNVKLFDIFD